MTNKFLTICVYNVMAGGGGNNTIKIVIITISAITGAAVVLCFFLYFLIFSRKSRRGERKSEEILLNVLDRPTGTHFMEGHMHDQDNTGETYYFNLTTILAATNNFSDSNKLGEGGFGPVYKGKLLDGREIAVKRLSTKSGQGLEEFKNEVMLIVELQHKNLVRLLGCCMEGDEKLLVYEYMANTSLDAFLFDPTKCKELDWDKRAAIVRGIARGILYLHEDSRLKIIHRDLKASNVLLDEEMNAKISDFGTARIFGSKQLDANTDRVVGTFGYMAPEYAMEGLFSVKSDTYSFGVLLLEILSGKKNSGLSPLSCQQAWQLWNEDKRLEFIDRNLLDKCPVSEAVRWIHIALLCVQEDPNDRPPMSSVALMLGSKWVNLPQPSAPPFSVGRSFMSVLSSTTRSGLDAHPSTGRDVYQYDGSHIEDGIASKITRCICIGLLCVPEDFADRPKMPSVLFMLDSHSWSPVPSQPSFLCLNLPVSMFENSKFLLIFIHLRISVGMFDIQDTRAFPLMILISIFSLISFINAQPIYDYHLRQGQDGDTANRNFETNISSLLDSVSSKASLHKFYNDSSNQIYSLYQCRGDVNTTTCHTYVKAAAQEIQEQCRFDKKAIIWFDACMVGYSNQDFFGIPETYTGYLMWNNRNSTESSSRPDAGALALIYELVEKASNSERMFEMDERVALDNPSWKIYGLVQCTRDISNVSCKDCLVKLLKNIEQCCRERLGWRIMSPSCHLRYGQIFYQQPMRSSGMLML
ncbi:G-type lectin S-receptor-like serine/threonine-protein kinase RKS1 [Vitis vinifera]|uniref:non-specific serine/threonine protein kinase n=1 Tax=Vitis vinifera TaxID=29760 RepID=A0A438HRX8_VITVI|nr:G-type lectin S-receptor-like serine/threonine-protein kinase RKS1 [Vitis vinifera]